jgi:hypothetical protein
MAEGDQSGASLATEPTGNGGTSDSGNQTQTNAQSPAQAKEIVLKLDNLEQKDRDKLARFKSGNEFVKAYLAAENKLGSVITIPGKDATDDERSTFYKRLGRPESKDGYELDTLFLADGVTKDGETENRIRDIAFDLGLNKENARRLHKTFIELANKGAGMVNEMKEKARETLRKEWSGEYDKNIAMVGKILRTYGDAQTIQYMNSGPGNDPVMLRLLAKFGKTMSPDTLETGSIPSATAEDDGSRMFPNSPQMTGANRQVRIRQG